MGFAGPWCVWQGVVIVAAAVAVGVFFLFLKDITDWIEAMKTAARQKEAGQTSKYQQVPEEKTTQANTKTKDNTLA